MLQDIDCSFGDRRMEVVAEGVRPEQDWRALLIARRTRTEPVSKGLLREGRQIAVLRDAAEPFHQVRDPRRAAGEIHQSRREARKLCPAMNKAHGVSATRAHAAFIMMG